MPFHSTTTISPLLHKYTPIVLSCIIKNPRISPERIIKKTKITQATVYRTLRDLKSSKIVTATKIKRKKLQGENTSNLYTAIKQSTIITIDKKGVHIK